MSRETLENKIDQLIERTKSDNIWYEETKTWINRFNTLFQNSKLKELPRMSFENATTCSSMLNNSQIETISYRIGGGKVTSYYRTCLNCKNLKFVYGVVCLSTTTFLEAWAGCNALETIQEPFELPSDNNATWANAFTSCERLQNIRFAKNCIRNTIHFGYSPLLTAESAKSILLGLANFKDTEKEFVNAVGLHSSTWFLLEVEGATAPGGLTWEDYVTEIGWNK